MLSQAFSLSVNNQLNSGIIILNLDFQIVYWNNFVQYSSSKLLSNAKGKSIFDIFPELPSRWLIRKLDSVTQLKTSAYCSWEQRHHLFEFTHNRPITTDSLYMAQNCKFFLIKNEQEQEHICIVIEDATDVCHYQSQLQKTLDELAMASRIDGLTQVFNRKHWEECLAREFSRAKRFDHELALIMFDLDHFKKLNDTYGHLAGDKILTQVADIVNNSLRLCDIFGRYGGEEFAIILPETSLAGASEIAQRIRKIIANHQIIFDEKVIKATASIGVALLSAEDVRYEDLISRADTALYRAKTDGRNCVRGYLERFACA